MFGRKPRENLRILYEGCREEGESENLAEFAVNLKKRVECTRRLASENLVALFLHLLQGIGVEIYGHGADGV